MTLYSFKQKYKTFKTGQRYAKKDYQEREIKFGTFEMAIKIINKYDFCIINS